MTKHVATCKNTAYGHEQENIEGEPTASGSDARTVRQLTGEMTAYQLFPVSYKYCYSYFDI